MTGRRLSDTERAKRLERCEADYQRLKAAVADIGFICEGSLNQVYTSCRNPNCRCADPTTRHGPYWQLTWKQSGKTVTRRLSPDEARLYRTWIANRRALAALVEQMQAVSRRAGEQLTAQAGHAFHGPVKPATRPPK